MERGSWVVWRSGDLVIVARKTPLVEGSQLGFLRLCLLNCRMLVLSRYLSDYRTGPSYEQMFSLLQDDCD